MGTGCSRSVMVASNSKWEDGSRGSRCSTSTMTTASGSTLRTLTEASIWSPFQISRAEAEQLLSRAEPGAFVFSHDMTSELFLSICVGQYVCHHAVLTRDHFYYVGARKFTTIGDVVDYFKDHPLGEITLKREFKSLPRCTSQVQIRQHPDISIPCPANVATNFNNDVDNEMPSQSTVRTSVTVSDTYASKSPAITLTPHSGIPIYKEGTNGDDLQIFLKEDVNIKDKQQIPKLKRSETVTKKHLTRAMAIDRTDSSGEFQETALSPLLPARKPSSES